MKSLITLHATMTAPGMNLTGRDVDRRDRMHGFSKCGYHFVIQRDGSLYEGRKLTEASVHDEPEEAKEAMSLCLVGGVNDRNAPENNFTDEQWEAMKHVIRAVASQQAQAFATVKSKTPAVTTERVNRVIHRIEH